MLYSEHAAALNGLAENLNMVKPAIKILGHGKVVKSFLSELPYNAHVQVYGRSSPGLTVERNFVANENDIVVFCCSINEGALLKNCGPAADRLAVLPSNLIIVDDFLKRGYFKQGTVFILSNPSDLLAEYIRFRSKNEQVYALGLSYDFVRYQRVFSKLNLKPVPLHLAALGGNHYHQSCVVAGLNHRCHEKIREEFRLQVASEFHGTTPPIKSGAASLKHLFLSATNQTGLLVSGYSRELDCFTGGRYDFSRRKFLPELGTTRVEQELILNIAKRHKVSCTPYLTS